MNEEIARLRTEFTKNGLNENEVDNSPIKQFALWFEHVLVSGIHEPNAMALSTTDISGRPSCRIVLLKGFDEQGFTFYTNYNSRKGRELTAFPFASLTFFWVELERQVRIEGRVEKVGEDESDAYFAIRPRGSQIGAWVSEQSEVVNDKEELLERITIIEKLFEGKDVTRPPHWGGYRVVPDHIEFWQGRPNRLHDRILYSLTEDQNWTISRLNP
jgi:pyridoxamine 5'-phosphate oxidase